LKLTSYARPGNRAGFFHAWFKPPEGNPKMFTRAECRRMHDRLNELERLNSLREANREPVARVPLFSVVIDDQVRLEFEPEVRHERASQRGVTAGKMRKPSAFVLRVKVSC
jgi:hypothetical protein